MQSEDAEYFESVLAETKQRKAKLAAFVVDADAGIDYSEFDKSKDGTPAVTRSNDIVALDMALQDILEKVERARSIGSKASVAAQDKAVRVPDEVPKQQQQQQPREESDDKSRKGRQMTKAIASNRGLTRCRKKSSGNARVSNRAKYVKKVKKLSGRRMVADELQGHGGYDGESHGIAIHVNRSRRIT